MVISIFFGFRRFNVLNFLIVSSIALTIALSFDLLIRGKGAIHGFLRRFFIDNYYDRYLNRGQRRYYKEVVGLGKCHYIRYYSSDLMSK